MEGNRDLIHILTDSPKLPLSNPPTPSVYSTNKAKTSICAYFKERRATEEEQAEAHFKDEDRFQRSFSLSPLRKKISLHDPVEASLLAIREFSDGTLIRKTPQSRDGCKVIVKKNRTPNISQAADRWCDEVNMLQLVGLT